MKGVDEIARDIKEAKAIRVPKDRADALARCWDSLHALELSYARNPGAGEVGSVRKLRELVALLSKRKLAAA